MGAVNQANHHHYVDKRTNLKFHISRDAARKSTNGWAFAGSVLKLFKDSSIVYNPALIQTRHPISLLLRQE